MRGVRDASEVCRGIRDACQICRVHVGGVLHSPPIRSRKGPNVCTRAAESFYFRRRSLSEQGSLVSIYRKSAPNRLAEPRRSVRQLQTGLQGPVEVFASVKQACRAPSKCSPAPSRLAGPRRSLRQRQAGLQGPVEVFASVKQACRALSKCSPAPKQTGISPIDTVRPIRIYSLDNDDFINPKRNETHKNH